MKRLAALVSRHFPYKPGKNRLARMLLRPLMPLLPRAIVDAMPVVGTVRVPLPRGGTILLETAGDDQIAAAIDHYGLMGFEGMTIRVYLTLLEGAAGVLDIGANTGLYALLAAGDDPARRVCAFEPEPTACERLRNNVQRNRLANLAAENLALADHDGTMTLYVPPHSGLATSASLRQDFRDSCAEVTVAVTTLDGYLARNPLERVDLLKIDTEATEHLVLAGAIETLCRHRPAILCEVLHGRTEQFLQPLLEPLDYRFYQITDRGLELRATIVGDNAAPNYLFLPEGDERLAILPRAGRRHA